jgi:thiol:disulfide interchange protein DsbD
MHRFASLVACLLVALLCAPALAQQPRATVEVATNTRQLVVGSESIVAVVITIPEHLHAQSHTPTEETYIPLVVTPEPNDAFTIGQPRYPPGVDKEYPALGKLNVYEGRVVVHVPVTPLASAAVGPVALAGKVRLQMCDDKVCFAPQTLAFSLPTTIAGVGTALEYASSDLFAPIAAPKVSGGDVWYWFLVAFGAGIIFNLMPCVLPVLPLKAIGFYEAAQHNRLRSVGLALAFTVGIVSIFAALAVLILVTKQLTWGAQFSNPWFVWTMVAILLAMGVGLLGAFALRLPTAVYNVTPRHDTIAGNVGFGALTAVLSTPCTAPLFPGLLLWAQTQPTALGVGAMLTVGFGMAAPYLVLSAFPQLARRMPRVGPWAELFKQMMGWLLIGSAVFFAAGRVISGSSFLWAVVAVAAVAACFLVVRAIALGAGRRGLTVATSVAVLLFGSTFAYAGHMNGLFTRSVAFTGYSDEALATARAAGRPVVVKFTANWCGNCQYIEATVFRDGDTVDGLLAANVLPLKADLTHEGAPGTALLNELNPGGGIPFTAVYLPNAAKPVTLSSIYTTQTLLGIVDGAKAPSGPSPSTPGEAR